MTSRPAGFARLWLARISTDGLDDTTLLGAAERTRLASMSHPNRRRQFVAGRVLARKLIASRGDDAAAHTQIDVNPAGKPFLPLQPDLHFSISHSGEWVACAIASVPVGLDIERIDSQRATNELIDEVCSKEEQRLFASLLPERRDSLFTELWTLKEAWSKRRGERFDTELIRTIKWVPATAHDGNCSSWITLDGLAITVLGPPARLLSDALLTAQAAPCTTRRVEDL